MGSQIRGDDPYIQSARVGQFDPQTVRMVFELKQNVKPQLFALAPVAGFKERLVMGSIPLTPPTCRIRCWRCSKITIKAIFSGRFRLRRAGLNRVKPGAIDPLLSCSIPATAAKTPARWENTAPAKRRGAADCPTAARADRERGQYEGLYDPQRGCLYPAEGRVAKAQKQRADLFVSIHADAFTSRQPSGSSVFALSTKGATSTAAKYLAQTQNASDLIGGVSKSGDRYVDHTMFDMVQSLTIADSLKFGKAVLEKMGNINNLHKNRVEQAGFAVLKAPDIPSILVETAFISNVEEERKLKTAKFQQEVAESILAGIKAYFADGATLARRG